MSNKPMKQSGKEKERQLEKERTPLGTAVESNREKKVQGPNRPST